MRTTKQPSKRLGLRVPPGLWRFMEDTRKIAKKADPTMKFDLTGFALEALREGTKVLVNKYSGEPPY